MQSRTRTLLSLHGQQKTGECGINISSSASGLRLRIKKEIREQRNPTDRVTCGDVLAVPYYSYTNLSEAQHPINNRRSGSSSQPVVAGQLAPAQEGRVWLLIRSQRSLLRLEGYFRKWKALAGAKKLRRIFPPDHTVSSLGCRFEHG